MSIFLEHPNTAVGRGKCALNVLLFIQMFENKLARCYYETNDKSIIITILLFYLLQAQIKYSLFFTDGIKC